MSGRKPAFVTLGLYDPLSDSPDPIVIQGMYAMTPEMMQYLAEVLRCFRRKTETRKDFLLNAGVFPWKKKYEKLLTESKGK